MGTRAAQPMNFSDFSLYGRSSSQHNRLPKKASQKRDYQQPSQQRVINVALNYEVQLHTSHQAWKPSIRREEAEVLSGDEAVTQVSIRLLIWLATNKCFISIQIWFSCKYELFIYASFMYSLVNMSYSCKYSVINMNYSFEKKLYKKTRSILNKLTPQNFETLLKQIKELPINSEDRLAGCMDLVFEKVIIYNILFTFMLTINIIIISLNYNL